MPLRDQGSVPDLKTDSRRYSRGILGDPDRYSRGIWGRPRFLGRLREVYDFIVWNFWLLAGMVVLCSLALLLIYTMALYRDPIYDGMERFMEAVARFFQGRDGTMAR